MAPAVRDFAAHCVLQKFKEYVNGSNLITKLQAKHDLLKQTLGEGECTQLPHAAAPNGPLRREANA